MPFSKYSYHSFLFSDFYLLFFNTQHAENVVAQEIRPNLKKD